MLIDLLGAWLVAEWNPERFRWHDARWVARLNRNSRSLADDKAAARFDAVYRDHFNAVEGFVRIYHPGLEVSDVVQQTFMIAWRKLDKIPLPPDERSWLLSTARNVARNSDRSAVRQHLFTEGFPNTDAVAARDGIAIEDLDLLETAFVQLSSDDRELLLLAAWEEPSLPEVGRVLGISANAAGVRLHRARTRLRTLMTQAVGE